MEFWMFDHPILSGIAIGLGLVFIAGVLTAIS